MLILLETMAEERRTATAPELLEPLMARLAGGDQAVSYTHLTLPTKLEV